MSKPASTATAITQLLVKSGREPEDKREVLRGLIRSAEGLQNAIIFCNRKREVAVLHRSLQKHGFNAVALHGDMDQSARTIALDRFRKGDATILVASDVAARGLDIPEVSHVFNFDVPHHPDDYVHRIGRTGRAGRSGAAFTLIGSSADQKSIGAIEKLIGQAIPYADQPARSEVPAEEEHERRERSERPGRRERHEGHKRRSERPRREKAAVSRIDEAARKPSPERNPAPVADGEPDTSHLPAFLLRPIRVKA